jgi:hypothetical protein
VTEGLSGHRVPPAVIRLARLLRVVGMVDLLALGVLLLSPDQLAMMHARIGLGAFPADVITVYLARSASMLYGCCGVLLLGLSLDVVRYAPILRCMASCGVIAGGVLLAIGVRSGLPVWWIAIEGPSCSLIWGLIWWWTRVAESTKS